MPAFAGDVAGYDEDGLVGEIWDDLEEVPADFAGGAVHRFSGSLPIDR